MHGNSPDHGFRDPRALSGTYQVVENASWPHDVREIKDQAANDQVDVRVRIVFRDDGEAILDGRAIRWSADFRRICVQVNDPRVQTGLVWVDASDTRQR